MFRIGRTCSVPTEACAYQVPSVPCFLNTCVRESVYSARFSSGTAQSSMNETGLPSPFIDIMMLRPALRTSQSAFCLTASRASPPPSAPPPGPLRPASPRDSHTPPREPQARHELPEPLHALDLRRLLRAGEFHQQ